MGAYLSMQQGHFLGESCCCCCSVSMCGICAVRRPAVVSLLLLLLSRCCYPCSCRSNGARVIGEGGELVRRPFDPQEMEAVMRQPAPSGAADGDVLAVLRKGYAVGDRLVRPALVVVAYED